MEMSLAVERLKTSLSLPVLDGKMNAAQEKKLFDVINQKNPSVKEIENLINGGVDINCRNEQGMTPLLQLAKDSGSKQNVPVQEIVRFFVAKGVDVNVTDTNQSNALHWFCCSLNDKNLINIVRLLLKKGVDVNAKDKNGKNALHHLCSTYKEKNIIDVIHLLIKNGIRVNEKDSSQSSALHWLCSSYKERNMTDIVRFLLKKGVGAETNKEGLNALHYLFMHYKKKNLIDIVRSLLQYGVNVFACDKDGEDTRDYLSSYYTGDNGDEIMELLESKLDSELDE